MSADGGKAFESQRKKPSRLPITDGEKEVVRKNYWGEDGTARCAEILGCPRRRVYAIVQALRVDSARGGRAPERRRQKLSPTPVKVGKTGSHADVVTFYATPGWVPAPEVVRFWERRNA